MWQQPDQAPSRASDLYCFKGALESIWITLIIVLKVILNKVSIDYCSQGSLQANRVEGSIQLTSIMYTNNTNQPHDRYNPTDPTDPTDPTE